MEGEIPYNQWAGIASVRCSSEDTRRVMDLLSEPGQEPWVHLLGVVGVETATKVNLYPFAENMGISGKPFDEKKQRASWLGPEAMCMVESGFSNAHRNQVLLAFKKFVEHGTTNPDDLPLDDPQVIEANAILDSWSAAAEQRAQQSSTPEALLEYSLLRSTIYVDAGFTDPTYLDEVANDWLAQDLQEAADAGLTAMADRIRSKIDAINTKLHK